MDLPSFLQPSKWYAGAFYALVDGGYRWEMNSDPYWGGKNVALEQLSKLVPQHGVLGLGESTHNHALALYEWDKTDRVWRRVAVKEFTR